MKYSTSPSTSRCHSPSSPFFYSSSSSTMPMPVTYRNNCMSAASKCYKYLRKLLKFGQMDFEFAIWQVLFLLVAPRRVYQNFQNRKRTKSQFARDDPAFLVLLGGWLLLSSVTFAIVFGLSFMQFFKFLFYATFFDCIGAGLCVATLFWYVANHYMRYDNTQDVEWGYAFDIHLNAIFPLLIILNVLLIGFYHTFFDSSSFSAQFIGNTIWLIAANYYVYITFLGYTSIEILNRTAVIFWALPVILIIYIVTLCARINISRAIIDFYMFRIHT